MEPLFESVPLHVVCSGGGILAFAETVKFSGRAAKRIAGDALVLDEDEPSMEKRQLVRLRQFCNARANFDSRSTVGHRSNVAFLKVFGVHIWSFCWSLWLE
jgi:hypothetical protein